MPAPGPTDVLVRVEVVAVDPVDTMMRSGAYPTPTPFPFVVGQDLVGTVAALHPAATAWLTLFRHGGLRRLAAGDLPVRVRQVWPLERTAEAHRAVEHGVRGRIVLRVAGPWTAR